MCAGRGRREGRVDDDDDVAMGLSEEWGGVEV